MVLEVIRKENEMLIKKGRKEGRIEGRIEGKKEGKIEMLKQFVNNMIKRNMSTDEIQEITGISKEELEQIQKSLHSIWGFSENKTNNHKFE